MSEIDGVTLVGGEKYGNSGTCEKTDVILTFNFFVKSLLIQGNNMMEFDVREAADHFLSRDEILQVFRDWELERNKHEIFDVIVGSWSAEKTSISDEEAKQIFEKLTKLTGKSRKHILAFFTDLKEVIEEHDKITIVEGKVTMIDRVVISAPVVFGAAAALAVGYGLYKHASSKGYGFGGVGWTNLGNELKQMFTK